MESAMKRKESAMKIVKFSSLIAGMLLGFLSLTAHADPAIIITDFGCGMLDGDGGFVGTTDSKVVNTNNANGIINFKCHVKDVANSTGMAVHWDYETAGFSCNTLFGSTTDWKETVSADGNAVLTCKIHPNS